MADKTANAYICSSMSDRIAISTAPLWTWTTSKKLFPCHCDNDRRPETANIAIMAICGCKISHFGLSVFVALIDLIVVKNTVYGIVILTLFRDVIITRCRSLLQLLRDNFSSSIY